MSLLANLFTPTHIVALQKITQAITGLGTALMVAHFLSPEEQGYFYTMGSLLSSYVVFDLGLSSYLLQRSAQLSHGLTTDSNGNIYPPGIQRDEFIRFAHWVFKWYRNTGVVATLILAPLGIWALTQNSGDEIKPYWFFPWLLIAGAVGINMPTIGILAVLEGSGRIKETYLLRIAHYALGGALAWCSILLGIGLYAQVFPILATALACYGWIFYRYHHILRNRLPTTNSKIKKLILGQVKYTACIWLTNYIFLNAPVILSFVTGDVIASGQLGLSIILANVGGAVAMSAFTAKLSETIQLIKENKTKQAEATLYKSMKAFLLLYSSGSLALVALVNFVELGIFSRLLDTISLALLLASFAGFHIFNALIIYHRAKGSNAQAIPSLLLACCIIISGALMGSFSTFGILVSMFTFSISTVLIFWTKKNKNKNNYV